MDTKPRVLVVDDDPVVRRSCERILSERCSVQLTDTGTAGLALLESEPFDAALLDLKLPDMDGMEILARGLDAFPDVPVIIITGYSTVSGAVDAIKRGAFDYIAKPFTPDQLEVVVEKATRQRRLLLDYRELQNELSERHRVMPIIGDSPAMKKVFELVEQVARTDSTVLLVGESGTGKELVANAIHSRSLRKDGPFVAVDCGSIAPGLIASELFGHVRGSFTGATADRSGLIQAADGGTLFLDEIGNLPLDLQASLLRVIETREVRAVGASASIRVDVRYISATNRELNALVSEEQFREDLAYRLNVFPLRIPALKERPEDIPALAEHFLRLFSTRMHKKVEEFTEEALNTLARHEWPGNVRELSNVVERLVILCGEGKVGHAHLTQALPQPIALATTPRTAEELNEARQRIRDDAVIPVEKSFLTEALRRNDYNVTKAADETGMQRSNFQSLLKKHGLRIKDIIAKEK
ncbi:sigma-54-dependent transcriptional regulator [Planctomycetota bacterium]